MISTITRASISRGWPVGNQIEVRRGISTATGAPAAFVSVATIPIDSVASFQTIFAQHGAKILADIPNYTNIEPIVQFDEIVAVARKRLNDTLLHLIVAMALAGHQSTQTILWEGPHPAS